MTPRMAEPRRSVFFGQEQLETYASQTGQILQLRGIGKSETSRICLIPFTPISSADIPSVKLTNGLTTTTRSTANLLMVPRLSTTLTRTIRFTCALQAWAVGRALLTYSIPLVGASSLT